MERKGAILVLLVLLLPLMAANGAGSAPSGPEQTINLVSIDILEDSIPIDVSMNGTSMGQVHWMATLLVQVGILVESVDVVMVPEFTDEITVSLSDYDFTLTKEQPEMEFYANVSVRTGTSSRSSPELVLDGSATAQPHNTKAGVEEDSLNVVVLPFYAAKAEFKESTGALNPGGKVTYSLIIENMGNADGTYLVSVQNDQFLRSKGITVDLETAAPFISEKEKRTMDVTVKASEKVERGAYTIEVLVAPEVSGPGNIEGATILTIDVQEEYATALQKLFRTPLHMYIAFAVLVFALAALAYGAIKLREHMAWRRTLRRIKEEGRRRQGGKGGP